MVGPIFVSYLVAPVVLQKAQDSPEETEEEDEESVWFSSILTTVHTYTHQSCHDVYYSNKMCMHIQAWRIQMNPSGRF